MLLLPMDSHTQRTDLNELLWETIADALGQGGFVAAVETDLAPDLPPVLRARAEVEHLLTHLVGGGLRRLGRAAREGRRGVLAVATAREGDHAELRIHSSAGGGIASGSRVVLALDASGG